jgi:glycosyltransferase involved in cell wall biosynthesis
VSAPERTVGVVIPVYNGARYLAAAIDSVLAQAPRPLDVVVVDDGSTDDSAAVARRMGSPVRCIQQEHTGLSAAWNRGVAGVAGALLAFLDADDLWVPGKLERQLALLDADPALEAVFGHIEEFTSRALAPAGSGAAPRPVMRAHVAGTMLIRRDAFLRVGPFDPRWRIGGFMDWLLRATDLGLASATVPEVLLRRRVHDDHMTLRERASRRDYARILKVALDRRRGVGPRDAEVRRE